MTSDDSPNVLTKRIILINQDDWVMCSHCRNAGTMIAIIKSCTGSLPFGSDNPARNQVATHEGAFKNNTLLHLMAGGNRFEQRKIYENERRFVD